MPGARGEMALRAHPQLRAAGGQMGLAHESSRQQSSDLCAGEQEPKNFLDL